MQGRRQSCHLFISTSIAWMPAIMKIAAFTHQGQPHVGQVSDDLLSVTPWDLPLAERELGAQGIIERQVRGDAMPATLASIALSQVQLRAPLPRPRRNVFCVGKNYYAHAKEFASSGFDSSAKAGGDIPSVPIIFTKVPESVIATGEAIRMPGPMCPPPSTMKLNWGSSSGAAARAFAPLMPCNTSGATP